MMMMNSTQKRRNRIVIQCSSSSSSSSASSSSDSDNDSDNDNDKKTILSKPFLASSKTTSPVSSSSSSSSSSVVPKQKIANQPTIKQQQQQQQLQLPVPKQQQHVIDLGNLSDSSSSLEGYIQRLTIGAGGGVGGKKVDNNNNNNKTVSSNNNNNNNKKSPEKKPSRIIPGSSLFPKKIQQPTTTAALANNNNKIRSLDKAAAAAVVNIPDDDDDSQDELEGQESDIKSAWLLDDRHDEYYLSSSSTSESATSSWPDLRVPAKLFLELYPHQTVAVQWMARLHHRGIGGCLADDMGMGKTRMVLTFLGAMMRAQTIRNALIVAPKSVLRSWEAEATNLLKKRGCVPSLLITVVASEISAKKRFNMLQDALECKSSRPHILITSYGLVRSSTKDFCSKQNPKKCFWDYVVLDEGHNIKNRQNETSNACHFICDQSRKGTHRLLLSGTPILNKLEELWSLIDWATSGKVFGALKDFKRYFARPIEEARDKEANTAQIQHGKRKNEELQALIRPYFIQRLKSDVLKDKLPEKLEMVVWTHLSSTQRSMYSEYVDSRDSIVQMILQGVITSPLEAVTHLKKLAAHPLIAKKREGGKADLQTILFSMSRESIIEQSAKLGILVELVRNLYEGGHKTLVFSQSTMMLDIIERVLTGVRVSRIDGQTKEKDRQRFVDTFNSKNGTIDVMLLSTKAAGVGLTLTGASRVIVYDPSWTPAEDAQAVDRCYRIGQTKEVLVYRLIAAGTVEEKMYEKQIHKDGIRRTVLTQIAQETETVQRYFSQSELRELFTLQPVGVCTVLGKVTNLLTDWSRHQFILTHRGVVGLSRHDGFYAAEEPNVSQPQQTTTTTTQGSSSAPFTGDATAIAPVVHGRAMGVLLNESTKQIPVGGGKYQGAASRGPQVQMQAVPRKPKKKAMSAYDAMLLQQQQHNLLNQSKKTTSIIKPTRKSPEVHVLDDDDDHNDYDGDQENEVPLVVVDRTKSDDDDHDDSKNNNNDHTAAAAAPISSSSSSSVVLFQRIERLQANGQYRRLLGLLLDIQEQHYNDLSKPDRLTLQSHLANTAHTVGLLYSTTTTNDQ